MKEYEVIILDADGTILDSAQGITKAVQFGLSKIGIIDNDLNKFKLFLGPPMLDSFMKVCHLSYDEAYKAMDYSREYMTEYGIYESDVYPGIIEMLDSLKESKRLMVATAKPIHFAIETLRHHNLTKYFEVLEASPATGNEDMKSKIIKRIFDNFPEIDKDKVVMVGDRKHDIIGARENNIDSIAVTYGYGSVEELTQCSPTKMVNSTDQLKQLLTK